MNLKNLFTLIFSIILISNLSAQVECDCPESDWETEGICVEIAQDSLEFGWAPNECWAACFYGEDYTVIPCDDIDWGWEDDCDCPEEDWELNGICVEVTEDGETWIDWAQSECYAACWYGDFTIVECEDDWGWEDECECPEDDWNTEGLCVEIIDLEFDTMAYTTWVPSECYAACWFEDFTVVECDDNWGWEDECDCPEEDWNSEGICIEIIDLEFDSSAYSTWVPSECFAACWYESFTVVDCDDWAWWEDECDCPNSDWNTEGICVEIIDLEFDSTAYISWAPSECYAACWYEDYTLVDCDDADWEVEQFECDCPEEDWNAEGICIDIMDSDSTYMTWVPSECYAACWYEDYVLVECDWGWEWQDECDCPEQDWEESICIEFTFDNESYIEWVPSECYAACWYGDFTVVECEEWENPECDWDLECECEFDSEEGICIAYLVGQDTLTEWVPNECFATCWGFENYSIVDCEDLWDWNDEGEDDWLELEGDSDCVLALLDGEVTTLQGFLIGLHECEAIVLDDCILLAPIFETDQEYIDYLTENCPDWFGFIMDESDGPSLFKQFGESQSAGTTSTNDLVESLEVKLLGNPVHDQLDVQINATDVLKLNVSLRSMTGSTIKTEKVTLSKGTQVYSVNTAEMAGGTYLMTMSSSQGTQTLKFVVAK